MKDKRAWIFYSWLSSVVLFIDTFEKLRGSPSLTPGPDYVIGLRAISIIALFGLAYKKKIAFRILWQGFFVLHSYFIFKLFATFLKLNIGETSAVTLILLLIVYLPIYYANLCYAFMKKEIWG